MSAPELTQALDRVRNAPLPRVLLIGFLIVLLQVPLAMIQDLIGERRATGEQAREEVASKWGRDQLVVGPVLVVPFVQHLTDVNRDGKTVVHTKQRHARFLPERLSIDGQATTERRYRGIFEVPVYRLELTVSGSFRRPDFTEWAIAPEDIQWDRAQLWVQIADVRAIQASSGLRWNASTLPFEAGRGEMGASRPGIHAKLRGALEAASYEFSFPLVLNGSLSAAFAPVGAQSEVRLRSDWTDPSFQGTWLPASRAVGTHGFEAAWSVSALGKNYPQRWIAEDQSIDHAVEAAHVGVALVAPVDQYRMSERSVKYEVLFLALTFLVLWLFEVRLALRVHPVQYLLVGAAMCLFYLLELSLGEHFGFATAYCIAAGAVVALVGAYCIAVLRGVLRAAIVGGVLTLLYAYLYVLLLNQDYALLFGSIGLFVALGVVMALTQKIDWYEPVPAPGASLSKAKPA